MLTAQVWEFQNPHKSLPGNCLEFQHQRHAGQLDWLERSSWFSERPPPAPLNGEQWRLMFTHTHHTHARVHTLTCTHMHICICTHSNMHTRAHMYVHICKHTCIYAHMSTHMHLCICKHTHARMLICVCAHTCTHACTYVCAHTHTNTYLPYIEKKRKERRIGSVLLQSKQAIVGFYRNELSLHWAFSDPTETLNPGWLSPDTGALSSTYSRHCVEHQKNPNAFNKS